MALRWALGIAVLLFATLALLDLLAPPPAERLAGSVVPRETGTADPAAGRAVFEAHCTTCHGPGLQGTEKGPPLIHPYYRPDHHADLAIYLAVKNGVKQHHWQFGDMPPVPEVSPEEARDIVAHIRAAQKRAGLIP